MREQSFVIYGFESGWGFSLWPGISHSVHDSQIFEKVISPFKLQSWFLDVKTLFCHVLNILCPCFYLYSLHTEESRYVHWGCLNISTLLGSCKQISRRAPSDFQHKGRVHLIFNLLGLLQGTLMRVYGLGELVSAPLCSYDFIFHLHHFLLFINLLHTYTHTRARPRSFQMFSSSPAVSAWKHF